MTYILYFCTLLLLTAYSWGFVDGNAPFAHIAALRSLVYDHRAVSSGIYAGLLLVLFIWYGYFWRKAVIKRLTIRQLCVYGGILIGVLFFSYPAFSNDIFNYVATAKVTYLYRENPYLIMPIDIPNEPMLRFLQAANKTALYGPTWIAMTAVPYVIGGGNVLATMYATKAVVVGLYVGLSYLIWKFTKRISSVVLFAFNPLVIIDTLVSAHNDVAMMLLAVFAFYALKHNRYIFSVLLMSLSILVKGATVFLVPVFVYALIRQKKGRMDWEHVWTISACSMFAVFLLSPIREEIYSWYFIWVLTFVALRNKFDLMTYIALGFTFGLPLRFFPFAYTGQWGGAAPMIKKIVTFVPPIVSATVYATPRKV